MIKLDVAHCLFGMKRIRFIFNIKGKVHHLKDAFETNHRGTEFHRRIGKSLQGSIEHAQIRTKGDDGADGEGTKDDQITAKAIHQGGTDRTQQTDDDKEK